MILVAYITNAETVRCSSKPNHPQSMVPCFASLDKLAILALAFDRDAMRLIYDKHIKRREILHMVADGIDAGKGDRLLSLPLTKRSRVNAHRKPRIDPAKLLAYEISIGEVVQAVRESNADVGGRVLEMGGSEYVVRGRGRFDSAADIRRVALGLELLHQLVDAERRRQPRSRSTGTAARRQRS